MYIVKHDVTECYMYTIHNIGIFVNKAHAYFFFKIIAINIFKVNNFHLLIEISLAKYVILRKQVFNQFIE